MPPDNKVELERSLKRQQLINALLQLSDFTTTTAGLNRGGRELNPFLRGIADKPAALGAVKFGSMALFNELMEPTEEGVKRAKQLNMLNGLVQVSNLIQLFKRGKRPN